LVVAVFLVEPGGGGANTGTTGLLAAADPDKDTSAGTDAEAVEGMKNASPSAPALVFEATVLG
jgi:hypothetical protein